MSQSISRSELIQAQLALFVAISLQILTRRIGGEFVSISQYLIIGIEIALVVIIGFTANVHEKSTKSLHHAAALLLLALISVVNIASLTLVLRALIVTHVTANGEQLLAAAIAIFATNIIVYALWYWEIDSPGLTRTTWSRHDKDFQFTQQDMEKEFPSWQPEFIDYLFLSTTNAINFAPSDAKPLTKAAKLLMVSQSLVAVFTLALVIARSVSILGT